MKNIVLVHRLWLATLSWEHWMERSSARYRVVSWSWRGIGRLILGHLGWQDVADFALGCAAHPRELADS